MINACDIDQLSLEDKKSDLVNDGNIVFIATFKVLYGYEEVLIRKLNENRFNFSVQFLLVYVIYLIFV